MSTPVPRIQHAQAQLAAGQFDRARQTLQQHLRQHPHDAHASLLLASVAIAQAQPDQAAFFAQRAAAASPNDPLIIQRTAQVFAAIARLPALDAALSPLLAKDPANLSVRLTLARAALLDHRPRRADQLATEGLATHPRSEDLHLLVYFARTALGHTARAREAVEAAARTLPDSLRLASLRCHALNYLPDIPRELTLQTHRDYAALLERLHPSPPSTPLPPAPAQPAASTPRPLRVGLLSSDLRRHSVAYFIRPLLQHADAARVHFIACSTAHNEDAFSQSLRPLAHAWHNFATLNPADLAAALRNLQLDILIELHGHTDGHRLETLHRRPAPIILSYCGYPNTTALPAVGFRLVDALTDPAPDADRFATEQLIRLDPCFLCYAPPPDAPPIPTTTPTTPRPPGHVTLGCFNALLKCSDPLLDLWARTLAQLPHATLLLKNHHLNDPESRDDLLQRLTARGIDPQRLTLRGYEPSPSSHLNAYLDVDIALDTFPYHGTTTTCEALLMGTPVVSLIGDRHASRVGLSLLSAVGLPELAVNTPEAYTDAVVALANDPARRASLRASLRDRLLNSPLGNAPAFAQRFTAALEAIAARR
jgi:predicted O-linked N-acetylglucosamine transferase (SPINDLY family)